MRRVKHSMTRPRRLESKIKHLKVLCAEFKLFLLPAQSVHPPNQHHGLLDAPDNRAFEALIYRLHFQLGDLTPQVELRLSGINQVVAVSVSTTRKKKPDVFHVIIVVRDVRPNSKTLLHRVAHEPDKHVRQLAWNLMSP